MVFETNSDEMYDDYEDYDEDEDYEEDIETDTEQVAYNPNVHKPDLLQKQINQVKQIVPRSETEIRKALQEGGSVEGAIDLLLQGKNTIIFWEGEAKCSFEIPYVKRFASSKNRPLGKMERIVQMKVDQLEEEIAQISLTPEAKQVFVMDEPLKIQEKSVSLATLASSSTSSRLSLSSLQSKSTAPVKPAVKNTNIRLSSLSLKNVKTSSKPGFTLSQLTQSSRIATVSLPSSSFGRTVKKSVQSAAPSEHGLFLSASDLPHSSPLYSFQLTPFLDNEHVTPKVQQKATPVPRQKQKSTKF
jgi:DNA-binding protein YbaB